MKTSLGRALLATLGGMALLAAPALAWDNPVNGRPDGFDHGDNAGVYLWHSADGWHLQTTDPAKTGAHTYTGTITTDGAFRSVHLVRPEGDDSAMLNGDGQLSYSFKTADGIDGVDWRVEGGQHLTFTLYEDGQLMSTSSIYLGDSLAHPDSNGFTVNR